MARPLKPLNDDAIYAMAERGWSDESIGAAFGVSGDTIKRRYKEELTQCRQEGKAKLLDLMYELAFSKQDVQAAKYLCDRRLGPIERKTTITLQDAQRAIEIDLQSRGIAIDSVIESLTSPDEGDDTELI